MEASQSSNAQVSLTLIHGAWLSGRSWDNYADYLGKRGFAVSAPECAREQGDIEEIRETADESAGLGVQEIVDHYAQLIGDLDQPPVLVGHFYGGLFDELLLDRGFGRAGVAMSPAPPKGILVLPFSTLKAASPALAHPSKWHGVVTLTPEEFPYAFVNTCSGKNAAAYEQHAVPETGQIFFEGGFATSAKTDYLEFERRPHLHMDAPDSEEVAAAIDSWLDGVLDTPLPATDQA